MAPAAVKTAYKKAWYEANKERIAAKARTHYQEKRDAKLAYQRAYRNANPEKVRQAGSDSYARNREQRLKRCADYRKRNPTVYAAWVAANREALAARKSAYKKANAARNAAHAAAYHAAKLQRIVPFSDMLAIAAIYAEAEECRALGADVNVDHDIPLRGKFVSGLHVHWNLKIIPRLDNLRKHNRFDL